MPPKFSGTVILGACAAAAFIVVVVIVLIAVITRDADEVSKTINIQIESQRSNALAQGAQNNSLAQLMARQNQGCCGVAGVNGMCGGTEILDCTTCICMKQCPAGYEGINYNTECAPICPVGTTRVKDRTTNAYRCQSICKPNEVYNKERTICSPICGPNSKLSSDGTRCICDDGMYFNAELGMCAQLCPAHATHASNGLCECDAGYAFTDDGKQCVDVREKCPVGTCERHPVGGRNVCYFFGNDRYHCQIGKDLYDDLNDGDTVYTERGFQLDKTKTPIWQAVDGHYYLAYFPDVNTIQEEVSGPSTGDKVQSVITGGLF